MRSEQVTRRVEELERAVDDLDRRLSGLIARAAAFADEEGLADRPEYFRCLYLELGEQEVLARLERILSELGELDPGRALERAWIAALGTKARYHLGVVQGVKAYRDRLARLLHRPATPFAPPDVQGEASLALAACEELAELPELGWTALERLGRVRWLLGDRAGAIAALETYLRRAEDAGRRGEARALLAAIRSADPAAVRADPVAPARGGADAPELDALRRLRDHALRADPVARDFFHVFWSRYYEWSPHVARSAARGPAIREHLRWAFLEPWLAWLELVSGCGAARPDQIPEERKLEVMDELLRRRDAWVAALPAQLARRRPPDDAAVFAALDRVLALLAARPPARP